MGHSQISPAKSFHILQSILKSLKFWCSQRLRGSLKVLHRVFNRRGRWLSISSLFFSISFCLFAVVLSLDRASSGNRGLGLRWHLKYVTSTTRRPNPPREPIPSANNAGKRWPTVRGRTSRSSLRVDLTNPNHFVIKPLWTHHSKNFCNLSLKGDPRAVMMGIFWNSKKNIDTIFNVVTWRHQLVHRGRTYYSRHKLFTTIRHHDFKGCILHLLNSTLVALNFVIMFMYNCSGYVILLMVSSLASLGIRQTWRRVRTSHGCSRQEVTSGLRKIS